MLASIFKRFGQNPYLKAQCRTVADRKKLHCFFEVLPRSILQIINSYCENDKGSILDGLA